MKPVHVRPVILSCMVEFKELNKWISKLHSKISVVHKDHVASLKVKIII